MTLPEVLRVALIRTGSELQQKVITQPHGHGICPQVETVLLAMPAGMYRRRLPGYLAPAE